MNRQIKLGGVIVAVTILLVYGGLLLIYVFEKQIISLLSELFLAQLNAYDSQFYLELLYQLPFRWALIFILVSLMFRKDGWVQTFATKEPDFLDHWLKSTSIISLLLGLELSLDIENQRAFAIYYRPEGIMNLLSTQYPTTKENLTNAFLLALSFSTAFILPRLWVVWASGLCFFLIQVGYATSLGKVEHTYATFLIVLMLVPLVVYEAEKSASKLTTLFLLKFSVAFVYCWAALEKLAFSGLKWVDAETLNQFLKIQQRQELQLPNTVISLMLWVVLLFQLTIPLAVFFRKLKWGYFGFGVIFHLATFWLLGAGGFTNPWFWALTVLLL